MSGKIRVVVEVVGDAGPLSPAPSSVSEADFDALLGVLAAGDESLEEQVDAPPMLDLGISESDATPELTQAPAPEATPEDDPDSVPMAMLVQKRGPGYEGAGGIVEFESDAQREAREEKEARIAAIAMAEERAKAAIIAKAEAEAEAIRAKAEAEAEAIRVARAERDAKIQKREEARQARKDKLSAKKKPAKASPPEQQAEASEPEVTDASELELTDASEPKQQTTSAVEGKTEAAAAEGETEAAAPVPTLEAVPEVDPDSVPLAVPVKVEGPYTGSGGIVEFESDAQREAREEKAARIAAVAMAEENAKAAILAKAEAEAEVIRAARAEMDEKKRKRLEARQARKESENDVDGEGEGESSAPAKNVQERMRGLSAAEQQKVARTGDQRERVVLERMYGKNVWEGLLRNPKLTPPEAGRIARMGSLPVPLLEIIVGNRAWLSAPQVRRALFTNPRLKKDMLTTVLRATPKAELKLMPKQMAYPAAVRQAAKRLIKY